MNLKTIIAIAVAFTLSGCENEFKKQEAYEYFHKAIAEDNIENARGWAKDVVKYGPDSKEAKEAAAYIVKADSILELQAVQKKKDKILNNASLEDSQKEFSTLIKEFRKEKDEFTEEVRFYPKNVNNKWPRRTTLLASVDENGTIFLVSNYFSEDWIFHHSITAKIDGETYSHGIGYGNGIQEVVSGGVFEVNTYEDEEICNALLKTKNETVRVRFEGRQFYKDITLSSADIKALKNCAKLSMLIKQIKKYEDFKNGVKKSAYS